jgi:hypothetical protein
MPYNGSGTFNRVYDWTTDEANSINIEASRMDGEDDGFATGLSTCITKDGQTTISANIPFNSKKITGLGNGTARADSIALGQVQDGTYGTLGTTGGSADTYTASPSPSITAYATGMRFIIKISADNTGASTLNISAVGAKDMKKYDGAGAKIALEAGDLQQDQYYDAFYDGTDIVVLNPQKPYLDTTNFANPNFNPNLVINGQGAVNDVSPINATTTPINSDDTVVIPGFRLLSDGNDIADITQETTTVPTGSYSAIKFDQETANKQWGIVQILNSQDSAALIGGSASLSFKARKGGSNATLETLRAAIISWDSTADAVTTDVVGTWVGAGTDPTLATNWTYENTPSDLTLTTSYQEFKIQNTSVDTASTANVALFIWLDDTDATVADTAFITDIKLEEGTTSTDFKAIPIAQERATLVSTQDNGLVTGSDRILDIKSASGSSELAFSGMDGSYNKYEFEFIDILPAADAEFRAEISTDNGSTYITSGYIGAIISTTNTDATASATAATTYLEISNSAVSWKVESTSTKGVIGLLTLHSPSNTASHKHIKSNINYDNDAGNYSNVDMFQSYRGATTAINGIRFYFNGQNIASGSIIMRGKY